MSAQTTKAVVFNVPEDFDVYLQKHFHSWDQDLREELPLPLNQQSSEMVYGGMMENFYVQLAGLHQVVMTEMAKPEPDPAVRDFLPVIDSFTHLYFMAAVARMNDGHSVPGLWNGEDDEEDDDDE